VHMPLTGTLREMIDVPGDLFSVNKTTAENVPRLFARNKLLVTFFVTKYGSFALVLIAVLIVAAVSTVCAGLLTPRKRELKVTDFSNPQPITLQQGDEMGRFLLGSTVVLCFAKETIRWQEALQADSPLRMGEAIAAATSAGAAG